MNIGKGDWAEDDPETGPVHLTPGFILFLTLLLLPALAALAVYFGAWMVADDVYAAEQAETPAARDSGFATAGSDGQKAAGWKKALVGICPAH